MAWGLQTWSKFAEIDADPVKFSIVLDPDHEVVRSYRLDEKGQPLVPPSRFLREAAKALKANDDELENERARSPPPPSWHDHIVAQSDDFMSLACSTFPAGPSLTSLEGKALEFPSLPEVLRRKTDSAPTEVERKAAVEAMQAHVKSLEGKMGIVIAYNSPPTEAQWKASMDGAAEWRRRPQLSMTDAFELLLPHFKTVAAGRFVLPAVKAEGQTEDTTIGEFGLQATAWHGAGGGLVLAVEEDGSKLPVVVGFVRGGAMDQGNWNACIHIGKVFVAINSGGADCE